MSKPQRRRSTRQPPTLGRYVGGPIIARHAPPYVTRWHRVDAWAESTVHGDVEPFFSPNRRVAGWRGSWVLDINNEEEAFERGIPVEAFGEIPDGPGRDQGGARRVSIRLFTWTVNAGRQGAYEPQWITTGWGMSGRSAAHAHGRWVDAYADAVSHGIESRRLVATAMEIVYWTAGPSTDYV